MRNFELSVEEVQELKAAHRKMAEKYAADCVKAIILLGKEWSLEEVSEAFNCIS